MKNRGRDVARGHRQILVARDMGTRQELLGPVALHRRRLDDAPRQPQRIGGNPAVAFGAQIVGPDRRRLIPDPDL